MSMLSVFPDCAEQGAVAVSIDLVNGIKVWARCGLVLGANLGLVLAAIAIALSFSAEVSTVDVLRTLFFGMFGCALMASSLSALAAALYHKAILQRKLA